MDAYLIIVIVGAVLAGFVQGLSGFAFSLVALSVWAWAVEPQLAAPMAVFGSLVGQLVTLPLTWRGFSFTRLWPFALGGVIGVPLGIFILHNLDPAGFRLGLGLFLLVYCPVAFFFPARAGVTWGGKPADGFFGWVGGVMGGIGGMAGAVPALWANLRGWDKDVQRGVMQAFNITMHVTTLTGYAVASHALAEGAGGSDVFGAEALRHFAIIAPALVIPALVGAMLFRRMNAASFRKLVLALLFVSGVVLTASSV